MLTATNLSFERYFQPVFQPVNLRLERGRVLLVSGANGCGKTTLIRLLSGVLTPSSGELRSTANGLVYVGHLLGIKDDLSVKENLRFMQSFQAGRENESESRLAGAVQRLGLARVANQLARSLSAGQRKRCALARLLFGSAELWLLDEPYTNLDEEGIATLDRMLAEHTESGGACVLATHGAHRPAVPGLEEIRIHRGAESA